MTYSFQVLAVIISPIFITYNDTAGIYMENSTHSLNMTVKYPFDYNNKTVVYTDEDAPLNNFNFDPAIEVCAKLFVGVSVVTCIAALATLLVSCVVHRNERVANKVLIAVSTHIFFSLYFLFVQNIF